MRMKISVEIFILESTNSGPTAKLPILKLGEYEMWAIRIKQYFQIQDYALWEVIENGDSWVSVSQTSQENGITVTKMSTPATAEEKTNKKNDVKARGLLLMALLNEHQLTFSQYPDAKSMFAAIETRFGGNAATKKTQKTLLKQQYENFSATSAESLDSIFNRLQKIVSRLAILGVIIAQEDLNLKILSSLPPEWNTHVVVWMNKPEVETMSIDDLYNNFKIVEQKVKKTVVKARKALVLILACPIQFASASVSDNIVYAFMVENPNGSNVLHQDLEQIHKDNLEAMIGCSAPKARKSHSEIKTTPGSKEIMKTLPKAMLAIDGVGFDWSDMAEEQVQTNMALMAFSDSEAITYKRGLDTVEAQLVTYRRMEGFFFVKKLLALKRKSEFKGYGPENSNLESNVVCETESDNSKENSDKSLVNVVNPEHIGFGDISKSNVHHLLLKDTTTLMHDAESNSKAFRVYNTRTKRVEENLHVGFLENKPMIEGTGPKWLFDIDSLTQSMNYVPVTAGKVSNDFAGTSEEHSQDCIVMPIWKYTSYFDSPTKDVDNSEPKTADDAQKQVQDGLNNENAEQERFADDSSTKDVNAVGQQVNTASPDVNIGCLKLNVVGPSVSTVSPNEEDSTEEEPEVDLGNITNSYIVPTTPNKRIHKDNPIDNMIGEVQSTVQTRRCQNLLLNKGFSIEPTSIAKALSDSSWVEAIQEELLQFKLQQVWILVDLPNGKKAIGTKWVFRNKKDERGIVIRNKARLVAQGHRQEKGINYEEVFAPVARIEAIRLFLAYASFMGFLVYQMNVKGAFLYGTTEEEVYVTQPQGFKDPDHPNKVYKVVKALFGLHQAPRAWYETLANYLLSNGFKRGKIDQTLFIKKQKGDILLVQVYVDDIIFCSTNKELCTGFEKLMKDNQDKYVAEILKKFNYSDVKSASTLVDLEKPLVKDGDADDVDVHLYRSMIGSLMYLTASRPDIMFAVCACARFQVTPKTSHLLAVKRIFRYLKGKPTLGLWYSRDSPFELVAYTDSDYAGATLDRKSTTGGCQFLGNRLISWQCKKQTVVATSTTEAEYVAAASCCRQVLWIQNQLLDYRVIITESSIRSDLHLADAGGIDCLPTATIFKELARMGYEKPSQRLTFYKAFFSPQ
ncbi:putative ribonuclease H-like domain-containing protein, partial [Tanacetum coccineum]